MGAHEAALRSSGLAAPVERMAPRWLGRMALAQAIVFLIWAATLDIFKVYASGAAASGGITLLALALFAGIAIYAYTRRIDVFPLAAVAGAVIILGAELIGRIADGFEWGTFLAMALWLTGSAAFSGRILTALVRDWRAKAARP